MLHYLYIHSFLFVLHFSDCKNLSTSLLCRAFFWYALSTFREMLWHVLQRQVSRSLADGLMMWKGLSCQNRLYDTLQKISDTYFAWSVFESKFNNRIWRFPSFRFIVALSPDFTLELSSRLGNSDNYAFLCSGGRLNAFNTWMIALQRNFYRSFGKQSDAITVLYMLYAWTKYKMALLSSLFDDW